MGKLETSKTGFILRHRGSICYVSVSMPYIARIIYVMSMAGRNLSREFFYPNTSIAKQIKVEAASISLFWYSGILEGGALSGCFIVVSEYTVRMSQQLDFHYIYYSSTPL